jgi:catechol 2,3-dioxygenase-like lactoylglutathione lyase family enzyme
LTWLGIDHVQMAMPAGGEEVARAFYVGVLGFTERPKPPELAARGGAWFEADAVRVHLGVDPDFRPARRAHAALVLDDLDALLARLARHGSEVAAPETLEGRGRAFVHDDFGNRIELVEGRA